MGRCHRFFCRVSKCEEEAFFEGGLIDVGELPKEPAARSAAEGSDFRSSRFVSLLLLFMVHRNEFDCAARFRDGEGGKCSELR